MLPGESWWGGQVTDGEKMPYTEASVLKGDMLGKTYGNPGMPIFLSSKGRYFCCEEAFTYAVSGGVIRAVSSKAEFSSGSPASEIAGPGPEKTSFLTGELLNICK
jgi:hypothetical protein